MSRGDTQIPLNDGYPSRAHPKRPLVVYTGRNAPHHRLCPLLSDEMTFMVFSHCTNIRSHLQPLYRLILSLYFSRFFCTGIVLIVLLPHCRNKVGHYYRPIFMSVVSGYGRLDGL